MPAYDKLKRRRSSRRTPHERGCWIYVPAVELKQAGLDPQGPPPLYRLWGWQRGSLLVRLYKPRT